MNGQLTEWRRVCARVPGCARMHKCIIHTSECGTLSTAAARKVTDSGGTGEVSGGTGTESES